jgi:hypothetical protein
MSVLGSRDFWELTRGQVLRDETKNFVPAIQAATLIGREPERYGFSASQSGPLAYELAPVPQGMQLARVAALGRPEPGRSPGAQPGALEQADTSRGEPIS